MNKRRKLFKLLLMHKLQKIEQREKRMKLKWKKIYRKLKLKLTERKRLHLINKELLLLKLLLQLVLLIRENWNPDLMPLLKPDLPWPKNTKPNWQSN
jgi:hypothetical protein